MKLISCNECGIVIDQDQTNFDDLEMYNEDGSLVDGIGVWDGDCYMATIPCPVCENQIKTDEKIS